MCACKHLQKNYRKNEHSLFIPHISKNDYDKPNVKNINDLLQYGVWKVQKVPIVLQSTKNNLKTKDSCIKNNRNKKKNTRNFKLKKKKRLPKKKVKQSWNKNE
jgi:hypothetical protein